MTDKKGNGCGGLGKNSSKYGDSRREKSSTARSRRTYISNRPKSFDLENEIMKDNRSLMVVSINFKVKELSR